MSGSPRNVNDSLSNHNDVLVNAAKIIDRSKIRAGVFEAIYKGKKRVKTMQEIAEFVGSTTKQVSTVARNMHDKLVKKVPGGYEKLEHIAPMYKKILNLASNKEKLNAIPTKVTPKAPSTKVSVTVKFPQPATNAKFISANEIDSFSKMDPAVKAKGVRKMKEEKIKELFQKIFGEPGEFKDWGGEKSDLFSTRVIYKGKRKRIAIAFKGRGTSGKLVPSKMGKNGDQILRLFEEPADIFLVVYNGVIVPSIISQMEAQAIVKAITGKKILFGTIDIGDLEQIVAAYKN